MIEMSEVLKSLKDKLGNPLDEFIDDSSAIFYFDREDTEARYNVSQLTLLLYSLDEKLRSSGRERNRSLLPTELYFNNGNSVVGLDSRDVEDKRVIYVESNFLESIKRIDSLINRLNKDINEEETLIEKIGYDRFRYLGNVRRPYDDDIYFLDFKELKLIRDTLDKPKAVV